MSTKVNKAEPLFRLSKNDGVPVWKAWCIRLLAIALSILVCAGLVVLLTDINPLEFFTEVIEGSFGSSRKFLKLLQEISILLCISLAVTPAFKMRFWNIGAEGQVLVGALATAACMKYLAGSVNPVVLIFVMLFAGIFAGMLWGIIPAIFKAHFGTNETLFTLMMNYVAIQLVAFMIAVWRGVTKIYHSERVSILRRTLHTAIWIVVGGLIFLAIRGGTGTSPANVSKVYFSDNMFLNQAATNPIFSFLSSASRSELKEGDYCYFSDEECERMFEQLQGSQADADTTEVLNTTRPNVVLVILESFGRTITDEIIDGKEVTPHLNSLKSEGIWFENLFANSYRTDRGTVAIMSGYSTHPKVSIMKYPQKAHTLPAISRSLHKEGYTTTFTYGGDANFTNTISYLYGTGIERVTDQRTLPLNVPLAQWGYADDVVCEYFADEVFELLKQFKLPYHRAEIDEYSAFA